MDWNSIKYFLAINEKGNVKQAAKTLGLSASTLFRQLNAIEESHGRLFERSAGHYRLTEQGNALLVLAKQAAEYFHEIERKSVSFEETLSGTVRITAPTSFANGMLMEVIQHISQAYPEINIEVNVDNELVNLVAYQADIALRVAALPPDQLIAKKLAEFSWGLYANVNKLACPQNISSLEDLKGVKVIGASGAVSDRPPYQWLSQHFTEIGHRANDLTAMKNLAEIGYGLALLPEEFKTEKLKRIYQVNELSNNKLWLLLHPDLRDVKRVRAVTDAIEQFFTSKSG